MLLHSDIIISLCTPFWYSGSQNSPPRSSQASPGNTLKKKKWHNLIIKTRQILNQHTIEGHAYVLGSLYSKYSRSTCSEPTLPLSMLAVVAAGLTSGNISAEHASPPIVSQASAGKTLRCVHVSMLF